MKDQIDDILAFIDQEELNPESSIDDYKLTTLLEREHKRLLTIDNLFSKKTYNLSNFSQSENILNQQLRQKEQYLNILKKVLIKDGLISETQIANIWNSVFVKN